MDEQTDEQIAELLQQGNEEALGVLVDRYAQKLSRYGKKFLQDTDNIDDIIQEVFIKVYEHIKSFDTNRKFSPWIYRIAHNTFISHLRKEGKQPLAVFDFDALLEHHVYEDPETEEKQRQEISVLIEKGLEKLTPLYREIIILHYFEDLSYLEISDVLHIPTGTVSIRLRRAREALKRHIQYEQ